MMQSMKGISTSPPPLWRLYKQKFPNLPLEVVERFSTLYNCIAYSIGVTDRWVWREIDVNKDGTSSYNEFIKFYRRHGLVPTANSEEAEVALLGKRHPGGRLEVKHAAKRVGKHWESKMGQGGIIRHRTLDVFRGTPYGELLIMLRRTGPDRVDPRRTIVRF